ncbi:hypothetical protein OIO90_003263 [Microbotryomycetes sp. JL221]|nr:hypothetical protein OIO90_003263 [Microbotryomycetes sp. JL221]
MAPPVFYSMTASPLALTILRLGGVRSSDLIKIDEILSHLAQAQTLRHLRIEHRGDGGEMQFWASIGEALNAIVTQLETLHLAARMSDTEDPEFERGPGSSSCLQHLGAPLRTLTLLGWPFVHHGTFNTICATPARPVYLKLASYAEHLVSPQTPSPESLLTAIEKHPSFFKNMILLDVEALTWAETCLNKIDLMSDQVVEFKYWDELAIQEVKQAFVDYDLPNVFVKHSQVTDDLNWRQAKGLVNRGVSRSRKKKMVNPYDL